MATNGHMEEVGVLVIGAGPTGLGAATRLNQLGYDDWLLIDKVGGRQSAATVAMTTRQ